MNFNIDFVANHMAKKRHHKKVNVEVLKEFVSILSDVESSRDKRVIVSAFRKLEVSKRVSV